MCQPRSITAEVSQTTWFKVQHQKPQMPAALRLFITFNRKSTGLPAYDVIDRDLFRKCTGRSLFINECWLFFRESILGTPWLHSSPLIMAHWFVNFTFFRPRGCVRSTKYLGLNPALFHISTRLVLTTLASTQKHLGFGFALKNFESLLFPILLEKMPEKNTSWEKALSYFQTENPIIQITL